MPLFFIGNNVSFDFLNSVLTDTRKSIDGTNNDAEVIRVLGEFTAVQSTITDNSDGFEATFRAGSDVARAELANSILVESDDLYDTGDFSAGIRVNCSVIANIDQLINPNGAAFISSDTLESSSPGFVNAGADDYRLVNAATAVDFCSNEALTSRGVNGLLTKDLDGQPRPVIGNILTAGSSYDAGAYENQAGLQKAVGFPILNKQIYIHHHAQERPNPQTSLLIRPNLYCKYCSFDQNTTYSQ